MYHLLLLASFLGLILFLVFPWKSALLPYIVVVVLWDVDRLTLRVLPLSPSDGADGVPVEKAE